jgi:hypothetical protein
MRFLRWLYAKDLEPTKRPKPAAMENIPQIKRKEVSIYKPTDSWTEEDDALFASIVRIREIDVCMQLLGIELCESLISRKEKGTS